MDLKVFFLFPKWCHLGFFPLRTSPSHTSFASSVRRVRLLDFELLFLSSILSEDENRNTHKRVTSCEPWLPSCCRHVRLIATVVINRFGQS